MAPKIKDPVLQHAPTRKSVACFGAVDLGNGVLVRTFCKIFNAETFQHFLPVLLRHRSAHKRMVIVLDNARYHHARLLRPFLRRYRRVLSLLFLPPYSPQLAPDRAPLEVGPSAGHAQSLLSDPRSSPRRREPVLQRVAQTQSNTQTSMLHNLRRRV